MEFIFCLKGDIFLIPVSSSITHMLCSYLNADPTSGIVVKEASDPMGAHGIAIPRALSGEEDKVEIFLPERIFPHSIERIIRSITHEVLHIVISELEGIFTSIRFDHSILAKELGNWCGLMTLKEIVEKTLDQYW